MKWVPRIPRSPSCARQPLDALLAGTLDERAGERLAAHLDACETCQVRLTELAAGPAWWLDASRWLEPVAPDMDPCVDDLNGNDLDEFDANYPNNETDLLESGLLASSADPTMIGSLGRYEVKRVVGAGGTGIVLQAVDTELNRTVAIKVLAPTLAAHGPARQRFARESQAVAAVAHENVVAVHHVEGGGRVPYLVMQYVDGDSLQELVIRNGPLDATTTLRITAQLAAALTAAHDQGLVHRDVKPANILVGPAGQRVWMTDFGLARAVDDASLTRTGFIAGTPHYMSPEQARGATVRSSSDLFGLGGVVYFMLTGRPPFRAERTLAILNRICTEPHRPVREVNPHVPLQVARLVDRLLAKSTDERFPNAESVRTECLRLLADQASPDDDAVTVPAEVVAPLRQARRRSQTYQLIGSAVALLLVAACFAAMIDLSGQLFQANWNDPSATLGEPPTDLDAVPAPGQPTAIVAATFQDHSEVVDAWTSNAAAPRFMRPKQTEFDDSFASAPAPRGNAYDPNVPRQPTTQSYSTRDDSGFSTSPPPQPISLPALAKSGDEPRYAPPPDVLPSKAESIQHNLSSLASNLPIVGDGSIVRASESMIWQVGFSQLEHAVLQFDAQLSETDDPPTAAGHSMDSFDTTLGWMETVADELEIGLDVTPQPDVLGPPIQPPSY